MTAKTKLTNTATEVDKLERILARLTEAEQRKFINEDILRLEQNGDLSYESIRTTAIPTRSVSEGLPPPTTADSDRTNDPSPPAPRFLPNNLPQTPLTQQSGNLIGGTGEELEVHHGAAPSAEPNAALALTATSPLPKPAEQPPDRAPISCHEAPLSVSSPLPPVPSTTNDTDPLEDLLRRAMAVAKVRRGRPPAFDERAKGQLVALLSVGISMRQAAALLGVSHTTVQNTLQADPALAEEVTASRFQAQLQPLACVIREARRSWRAATWLLKYLDSKIASHDETPDERRARQEREADEFFARNASPGVKQRRELT